MIASKVRRSSLLQQSASASRSYFQFNYPHSFMGVNNSFNNVPHKNNFPE